MPPQLGAGPAIFFLSVMGRPSALSERSPTRKNGHLDSWDSGGFPAEIMVNHRPRDLPWFTMACGKLGLDSVTTRNVEHVCKLAPSLAFEELPLHTSTVQILVHTRIYYGYTMDILWIYYIYTVYRYTFTFVSCLIMTVVRVSWARPTAGRALRLALFWRHRCLMLLGTSCHPSLRPCWVWIGVSFGGFEHTWKCCCTWLDQTLMKHRSKAFPA